MPSEVTHHLLGNSVSQSLAPSEGVEAPSCAARALAGAVTRVMALPVVEDRLERFVPWLAADEPGRG